MTIKLRPNRGKRPGFEYDITGRFPNGERFRERANAPVKTSRTAALRWAQAREAAILAAGPGFKAPAAAADASTVPTTPTLATFWPRVVADHYEANRKKPSTIDSAWTIFRKHLDGPFGALALDAITPARIATLKAAYKDAAPKTVNNILSVLSRILTCAKKWGVITDAPDVGLLHVPETEVEWYPAEQYRRLVDAARRLGTAWLVLVLLGGSAGLRRGEIRALKWTDLDFDTRMIRIKRAVWRTVEGTTKGKRWRDVPMTDELADALKAHRHLIGERVLYSLKQRPLSNRTIRNWMGRIQRHARLEANGGIHLLRHTFCSHLALASVPATTIKELAGHRDLKTTERYMHLAPADRHAAMRALSTYHGKVTKKGPRAA
jgi:integrase